MASPEQLLRQITALKTSVNEVIRTFYEQDVTLQSIEKAILLSEKVVELVKQNDVVDMMKVYKDFQPYALTHPFVVSVISVMMCRKLNWESERTLKAAALGGLLHNIGMVKMPDNIRYTHPDNLSDEDLKIYKTHPEVGMNILGSFPGIPAAVLQIVLQHHELNNRGYPSGLADIKIFPLAKVVCLADRFTKFVLERDSMMVDGLKPFVSDKSEIVQHDPDLLRALIKSFIKEERKK